MQYPPGAGQNQEVKEEIATSSYSLFFRYSITLDMPLIECSSPFCDAVVPVLVLPHFELAEWSKVKLIVVCNEGEFE